MTLQIIAPSGDKIVYIEGPEYSLGDIMRLAKEYKALPGYNVQFK